MFSDTLVMVQAAETAGFAAALLAEHYYPSSGNLDRSSADAWVFLGALARETTRIRLGSLVSPVTFRHPSVLAKMAVTLDHVSGGRAELGLGAGWLEIEHAAYGFPFQSGPERVDILEEQLQVITGLWTRSAIGVTFTTSRNATSLLVPSRIRIHPCSSAVESPQPDCHG